jgi:hypothetical protein
MVARDPRRHVIQNDAQERTATFKVTVVADEAQLSKLFHEKAYAGAVVPSISAKPSLLPP